MKLVRQKGTRALLLVAGLVVPLACASTERDSFSEPTSDDGGASGAETGPLVADDAAFADATLPTPPACSDDAKNKIFVVSPENVLYAFEPATLAFSRIGLVNCSTAESAASNQQIGSMAVDRSGTAWVNLRPMGETYKVDTKTAACATTGMRFRSTRYSLMNMGFSSESPTTERLYAISHGFQTLYLGRIDTAQRKVEDRGSLVGFVGTVRDRDNMELTGTSDGRLFGLYTPDDLSKPMTLVSIDKTNAEVKKIVDIAGTENRAAQWAYAFSFWGGDFWIYFSGSPAQPSKVIRYKAATDKTQTVVVPDVGFRISGAGVSTCAPLVPPTVN